MSITSDRMMIDVLYNKPNYSRRPVRGRWEQETSYYHKWMYARCRPTAVSMPWVITTAVNSS